MKVLAIIINIFFPGIGTLIIKKWGEAITQIILGIIAIILIFTGVGAIIGGPLAFIVWIWAIISSATSKPDPIKVVVQQKAE
jgi:hypothetical protein